MTNNKLSALVVDDDPAIRILVQHVLSRRGFEVEQAADGAAGLEKIMAGEHAVVILDLMMPRIDGVGVIRYLIDHAPEKLSRIIVVSAFGAGALTKVCPPVVHFLEKPFDIHSLLEVAADCALSAV